MNTSASELGPAGTDAVLTVKRNEGSNRIVEMYIWMVAAFITAGGGLIQIFYQRGSAAQVVSERYFEFLLAFIVFFFPLVFRLIFGALPMESIRRNRARSQVEQSRGPSASKLSTEIRDAEIQVLSDAMGTDELASSSATKLFAYYASNSRRLSQSIYSRAGVYLMVGVFVAFSGLAFFYLQTTQSSTFAAEGLTTLLTLAPKFGILFFVELVAFFFLRQYRSAMDEFRYYEAIKRNREETLALIRIAVDSGKEFDPLELVKSESFFSKAGLLNKGQSTEIVEARKLEKNEIELLEKVLDVVSRSKK